MRGTLRAFFAFGFVVMGGLQSWAACSSNKLAATDLAAAGFKLDYFTTAGDLPNGAVDMMYFSKGDCSCGFAPKPRRFQPSFSMACERRPRSGSS